MTRQRMLRYILEKLKGISGIIKKAKIRKQKEVIVEKTLDTTPLL